MKLRAKLGIAAILGALLVFPAFAVPLSDFTWTAPTNYVNGDIIPPTDTLTYAIYCSATSGGPYTLVQGGLTGEAANNIDVASCVNGTPGTYYFVATAYSTVYAAESDYSNEASRTYTVLDLGQVPNPPVLITVN